MRFFDFCKRVFGGILHINNFMSAEKKDTFFLKEALYNYKKTPWLSTIEEFYIAARFHGFWFTKTKQSDRARWMYGCGILKFSDLTYQNLDRIDQQIEFLFQQWFEENKTEAYLFTKAQKDKILNK